MYNHNIAPTLGQARLSEIDGQTIQKFLGSISSAGQRKKVYVLLKQILTCAANLDMCSPRLFVTVRPPKHKAETRIPYSPEQEKFFVDACKKESRGTLFLICLYAGLRKSEARALTFSDIDLTAGVIHVTKSINKNDYIGTPKNGEPRDVPILAPLDKLLARYTSNIDRRIFTIGDSGVDRYYRMLMQSVGLAGCGLSIHSLRHTYATRCVERDVPPKLLQKWLGHKTLEMTMNIYTHVRPEYEANAIQKYNRKQGKK